MPIGRGMKSNPFTPEERQEIAGRLGLVRRSMRDGKGIRQTEMADLVEVSHSHYSKCESGHNSFSGRFLEKFAERTGVCLDWLMTGKGTMCPGTTGTQPSSVDRDTPCSERAKGLLPAGLSLEQLVRRTLDAARNAKVVSAAEALAQATGSTYEEAIALVIARRLQSLL